MRYDSTDIPDSYVEGRRLPQDTLTLWLEAISRRARIGSQATILDVGCGTGRFSKPLSEHFGARLVGVDPSLRMLTQARELNSSPRIVYLWGKAEELPVADGAVALVYLSIVWRSPFRTRMMKMRSTSPSICSHSQSRRKPSPRHLFLFRCIIRTGPDPS